LKTTLLISLFISATFIRGQQTPVLGFIGGPGQTELHAILGIPGAVRLSPPISIPESDTSIHIAPGNEYALAEQTLGPMGVLMLDGTALAGDSTFNPIPGALAHPGSIVFSPTGNSAALYSAKTNELQVLSQLPRTEVSIVDYSSALTTGAPRVLAISDDAQRLLFADGTGTIYLVTPEAYPIAIYRSTDISALAFVPNSHDAILCDRSLDEVIMSREIGGARTPQVMASIADGITSPQSAVITGDGMVALVGDAQQHRVWALNLEASTVATYDLPFAPTVFDRLRGPSTFLISGQLEDAQRVITLQGTNFESSFMPARSQFGNSVVVTCHQQGPKSLPRCRSLSPTSAETAR
jgi:hypothetical protein